MDFVEGEASTSLKDFVNENLLSESFQKFVTPPINEVNKVKEKVYDNFVEASGINVFENYEQQSEMKNLEKFITNIEEKNTLIPQQENDETNKSEKYSFREIVDKFILDRKDEYNCVSPKHIIPIMSPLNSLHSKTDRYVLMYLNTM